MTAATTCSCTSALSNVPALARCVKARRSPTKSWQIAVLASLRPTICAPLADEAPRRASRGIQPNGTKGRADRAAFFVVLYLSSWVCRKAGAPDQIGQLVWLY